MAKKLIFVVPKGSDVSYVENDLESDAIYVIDQSALEIRPSTDQWLLYSYSLPVYPMPKFTTITES